MHFRTFACVMDDVHNNFLDFLKKITFSSVNIEKNKMHDEVKIMFKETVTFLKKFAIFLNAIKWEDQKLVVGDDLADISEEFLNFDEYMIVDTNCAYQHYKSKLAQSFNDNEIDADNFISQLLSDCLLYITNQLRDEDPNVIEIFEDFLVVKKCFLIFVTSRVLQNTKNLEELISYWIVDLLKIITEADGTFRSCPKYLKVFNVIKQILTSLTKCNHYCDLILKEISNKIKCVLSYYSVREEFSTYLATKTLGFEYMLWIMHVCVNDAISRGYALNKEHTLRRNLEMLAKCLHGKCPSVINSLIEDVLRIYQGLSS